MNTVIVNSTAANNPEFLEDIRNFSSDEIFRIFLENPNKELFLRNNSLTIKKYIRVFLEGYNYEINFEEKYGQIFFSSTNSILQKGIISVFLISNNYNQSYYHAYLSSLGYEQLEAILRYFHDCMNTITMTDSGINPILEQIRTRKEYLRVGLKSINKE